MKRQSEALAKEVEVIQELRQQWQIGWDKGVDEVAQLRVRNYTSAFWGSELESWLNKLTSLKAEERRLQSEINALESGLFRPGKD